MTDLSDKQEPPLDKWEKETLESIECFEEAPSEYRLLVCPADLDRILQLISSLRASRKEIADLREALECIDTQSECSWCKMNLIIKKEAIGRGDQSDKA